MRLAHLLCGLLAVPYVQAQSPRSGPEIPAHFAQAADFDSGFLSNPTKSSIVVHREVIRYASTTWLQLRFGENTNLPEGSFLRITASLDGAVQRHDGRTLADYRSWSAGFNGDQVTVELVAAPNSRANRFTIDTVVRGIVQPPTDTICGGTDDRVQSYDVRQGRLFVGCTGWMIGADLMLTAGHCVDSGTYIIEFNVPDSTASGGIVRSHPDDQYPFQLLATQTGSPSIGNDFAVNRVLPNSNTSQLPTDRNGSQWYPLGTVPGSPAGNDIRITGYGSTSPANYLYLVQKTHVGPLQQVYSNYLCYATDTTGGNSGSPIVHEQTGAAIGIHTNGGCSSTGGCNTGTRVDRADLQAAIQNAGRTPGYFASFGTGCPGTGTVPATCAMLNGSGGTSAASSAANEYAYQASSPAALSISGFRLWTHSQTGAPATIAVAIYANNGGVPAETPLATSTMNVGTTQGFWQADFTPAVTVPAGTFFIAADHSAQSTYLSNLTVGTGGSAYWRRPAGSGAWAVSTIVSIPSWQILCTGGGQTGAVPAIGHIGLPMTGESFHVAVAGATANAPLVLMSGVSDSMWSGNSLPFSLAGIGAPLCSVLVGPVVFDVAGADADGYGSYSFNVPNVPGLVGGEIFHQWGILDQYANQLGVVLSNGGKSTIGG